MRKSRVLKDNATYHVTARANRGEMILHCPAMKKRFMNLLERAKKKYGFAIHNFCIMGNRIFDYVAQNPVKAQLVTSAEEWEFGGIWHFINGDSEILDLPIGLKVLYHAYFRALIYKTVLSFYY